MVGRPSPYRAGYGPTTHSQPMSAPTGSFPPGRLLTDLPVLYALVLALRDAGLGVPEIAQRLEVPEESMPALLEIGVAKLAALQGHAQRDEVDPEMARSTMSAGCSHPSGEDNLGPIEGTGPTTPLGGGR